ncbi:unnamed protein product [Prorocentrum cordatum]|uniref:OTU domain-containing protein n=1 Tax=Prorocentrum cordatum TaxID=2364126 RepID=A0ABN9UBW4_9DINO|nr:unnamed protein product [Polarella glacialis]
MGRKGNRKYNKPADSTANQGPQRSGWKAAGQGRRLGGEEPSWAAAVAAHTATTDSRASGLPNWAPPGCRRIREGGDGNCLFHAIARQALGDTNLDGHARAEICDWMQQHLVPSDVAAGRSPMAPMHRQMLEAQRGEIFAPGNGKGDAMLRLYLQKMRCSGTWGSGLEALCAAYVYGRPVHVWNPDGVSILDPPSEKMLAEANPIRLLHNGRNHWDSALPSAADRMECTAGEVAADEDADLAAAVAASIQDFDLCSGAADSLGRVKHEGSSAAASAPSDDHRALQRALAASAAAARQERADAHGLGDATRAAELRSRQERNELLGRLAERCERKGEALPFGAGLASREQLQSAARARAQALEVDGVVINPRPCESQADSATASFRLAGSDPNPLPASSASSTLDTAAASRRRWGRQRVRQPAVDNGSAQDQSRSDAAAAPCSGALSDLAADAAAAPAADGAVGSVQGRPVLRLQLVEEDGCGYAPGTDSLEDCVAALCRLGFTVEESAGIIECCDGEIGRVKALYGIAWEGDKTVQTLFDGHG